LMRHKHQQAHRRVSQQASQQVPRRSQRRQIKRDFQSGRAEDSAAKSSVTFKVVAQKPASLNPS